MGQINMRPHLACPPSIAEQPRSMSRHSFNPIQRYLLETRFGLIILRCNPTVCGHPNLKRLADAIVVGQRKRPIRKFMRPPPSGVVVKCPSNTIVSVVGRACYSTGIVWQVREIRSWPDHAQLFPNLPKLETSPRNFRRRLVNTGGFEKLLPKSIRDSRAVSEVQPKCLEGELARYVPVRHNMDAILWRW